MLENIGRNLFSTFSMPCKGFYVEQVRRCDMSVLNVFFFLLPLYIMENSKLHVKMGLNL